MHFVSYDLYIDHKFGNVLKIPSKLIVYLKNQLRKNRSEEYRRKGFKRFKKIREKSWC